MLDMGALVHRVECAEQVLDVFGGPPRRFDSSSVSQRQRIAGEHDRDVAELSKARCGDLLDRPAHVLRPRRLVVSMEGLDAEMRQRHSVCRREPARLEFGDLQQRPMVVDLPAQVKGHRFQHERNGPPWPPPMPASRTFLASSTAARTPDPLASIRNAAAAVLTSTVPSGSGPSNSACSAAERKFSISAADC